MNTLSQRIAEEQALVTHVLEMVDKVDKVESVVSTSWTTITVHVQNVKVAVEKLNSDEQFRFSDIEDEEIEDGGPHFWSQRGAEKWFFVVGKRAKVVIKPW